MKRQETEETPEKSGRVGDWPLSHHTPHMNFFGDMNHHHKQCISTTQVHDLQKNGTYLLSLFPRYLSVCRMLWVSPCVFQKQSSTPSCG